MPIPATINATLQFLGRLKTRPMHINVKLTRQTLINLEKITTIAVIFQGVSGQMLEDVKAVVHSKTASTSSWLRM